MIVGSCEARSVQASLATYCASPALAGGSSPALLTVVAKRLEFVRIVLPQHRQTKANPFLNSLKHRHALSTGRLWPCDIRLRLPHTAKPRPTQSRANNSPTPTSKPASAAHDHARPPLRTRSSNPRGLCSRRSSAHRACRRSFASCYCWHHDQGGMER
jgi:hypothetical protein